MYSSVRRAFSIVPSARHHAICWPFLSVPWRMRQSASRPTYGDASRFVTSACSGWSASYSGAGIVVSSVSTSGFRSSASSFGVEAGLSGARVRVDDRELDLRLVGVEIEEELVHLVDDFLGARVVAVDLVDDEHDGQLRLQRLAQDEARLRQRPFARVDQQEDAVDHRQPAFDLAAEVGVTGRVDDVELDVADADGGVLREDRDPLLALEVHRVHDALVRRPGCRGSCRPARAAHRRASSCRDRRERRSRRSEIFSGGCEFLVGTIAHGSGGYFAVAVKLCLTVCPW